MKVAFALFAASLLVGCGGGSGSSGKGGSGAATGGAGGSAGKGGSAGNGGSSGGMSIAGAGGGGVGGGGTPGSGGGAGGGGHAGAGAVGGGSAGSGGGVGGASGGAGSGGGSGGGAGAGGASGGSAGGAGGLACGTLGASCCAADGGETCNDNTLVCLADTSCSCAKTLFGRYILRADGALLYETDPSSTAQTPVLNANTGALLGNIVDVLEGYIFGCAALSDGSVWCWRTAANGNQVGQLGNGTTDTSGPLFRATSVLTAANQTLTGVTALADVDTYNAGAACAITTGGALSCWGNTSYLLNGGTTLSSTYATPVTGDGINPFTGVLQVGIDGNYSCAVTTGSSSNEVWCWGVNSNANLGTGDTTNRRYPTKVVGLTNPTKVVPFGDPGTTCVIDGANVRCWGYNGQGNVGVGTTNTPVLAPSIVTLMGGTIPLSGAVDLVGGAPYNFICALSTNRTVQCWGESFQAYPTTNGVQNVVALGNMDGNTVRLLTSDGVYHIGSTMRQPNCGLLQ